jgi:hypothetical protein
MTLAERLAEYVRACFTGLWVQSFEHQDALAEIAGLCRTHGWSLATWDIDRGLSLAGQSAESGGITNPDYSDPGRSSQPPESPGPSSPRGEVPSAPPPTPCRHARGVRVISSRLRCPSMAGRNGLAVGLRPG